ncbi:hypothetical protein [Paenibacillus montanisoli]|uniref:CDI toxin immunity protein n=1 Tax=Paenibacillus montanisoli TaxID=2081970 RepID=UPI003B84983E
MECIDALGNDVKIFSDEQSKLYVNELDKTFTFFSWGKVDWSNIENKELINGPSEVIKFIEKNKNNLSDRYLIIWDNARYPVIETSLQQIINAWVNVISVSFDTFK